MEDTMETQEPGQPSGKALFTNIATQESVLPNIHTSTMEKNFQTLGRGLGRLVSEVISQATD